MKPFQVLLCSLLIVFVGCNSSPQSDTAEKANSQEKVDAKDLKKKPKKREARVATKSTGSVNWLSIDDLESASKKEARPVMVDLYTNWCGWCKRMDKDTFGNDKIAEMLNDKFYAVKFNAEQKEAIKFGSKTYNFKNAGRRGFNELAYQFANGRMSYPTIAFLDKDLKRINSFPGYKQAHQFEPLLSYIEGGHYANQTLQEFQQGFKSSIKVPTR